MRIAPPLPLPEESVLSTTAPPDTGTSPTPRSVTRIVTASALVLVLSGPGRTAGIAVFADHVIADLG
ncbi:hypothetical protein [Nocardiopsis kunsanensis]|uniref:Uncharacterized protein n=1 Tax=Nocardiopsis kunsanensis TaxID=141693 RepID=A0A918XL89_9ACTN|nr:hypothetical protein [Nocardiopsis kunsanensis]GHD36984.1 hypothetical protein GCM10007147_44710 [Nocardiopsis kunsanensis]